MSILKRIIGDENSRLIKKWSPLVSKINSLEDTMHKLGGEEFKSKTEEFQKRLNEGGSLDDLLPEAFALVREVSSRIRNERHCDVQLIGGIALHKGDVAEMRTGEGKTLVATLPAASCTV